MRCCLSLIVKAFLIISILILNSRSHLRAQTDIRAGFAIDIYDPSVNQFFNKYDYIDHIAIFYKDQKPDVINIYFRDDKAPVFTESYILSFDGDYYLLNKKYENFPLPNDAKAKLTYLQGINRIADLRTVYFRETKIKRDSIQHQFTFYSYTGEAVPNLDFKDSTPKLKGDVLTLTKKLEEEAKNWKPIKAKDSIIIFSGTVEKNGTIGPLKLIEGRNSDYSKKIADFLSKEATTWWPKMYATGSIRPWIVRISVRANKDGTMKISIL